MSILSTFKPSTVARQPSGGTEAGTAYVRPRYEITEEEDVYFVDVDLPGVAKKELNITLHDGLLEIVGRRSWQAPEGWKPIDGEQEDYTYRLRLMVGDRVEERKIHADSVNGVLRLSLPKEEEKKPRRIEIQ